MKILVAIVLIGAGVWLFHTGWLQRDSLKGRTQRVLAGVASHLEGSRQFPEHVWFMFGGGAAVALGAGLLCTGRKGRDRWDGMAPPAVLGRAGVAVPAGRAHTPAGRHQHFRARSSGTPRCRWRRWGCG